MKNNKKIVLKVNLKKLTLKIAELISNKCDWYDISDFKRRHSLYFRSATETHQEPHQGHFWAISGQKRKKKNGFPGLTWKNEELEIPLIWYLYWKCAVISSQYITEGPHHTLEEEKLIVIVIIKAPFLGTFILKIINYDFWTYRSPTLKSCSGLGATISF